MPLYLDPYDDYFKIIITTEDITSEHAGEYELTITLVDDKAPYVFASNRHALGLSIEVIEADVEEVEEEKQSNDGGQGQEQGGDEEIQEGAEADDQEEN